MPPSQHSKAGVGRNESTEDQRRVLQERAMDLGVAVNSFSAQQITAILLKDAYDKKPKSRMHYRINATREMTGARQGNR